MLRSGPIWSLEEEICLPDFIVRFIFDLEAFLITWTCITNIENLAFEAATPAQSSCLRPMWSISTRKNGD